MNVVGDMPPGLANLPAALTAVELGYDALSFAIRTFSKRVLCAVLTPNTLVRYLDFIKDSLRYALHWSQGLDARWTQLLVDTYAISLSAVFRW